MLIHAKRRWLNFKILGYLSFFLIFSAGPVHAAPGVNPLPAGDSNNAPPVCGAAGRDGGGNISGVVNTYYPVTSSANAGDNSLTLGPARGNTGNTLAEGDLLLVIQMQDAAINSTNTANYGDGASSTDAAGSTAINQTGLYEFTVVDSFAGNTVTLQSGLTHAYHSGTNQRFQAIRVPQYTDVRLTADVTAAVWDGRSGGVVVFDVMGTLDLNGNSIDVSAQGFRGGLNNGGTASGARDLDYVIANNAGNAAQFCEKGEGIAGTPDIDGASGLGGDGYPGGDLARGAPGNGGGGGQDHNSGGGGGGNIGAGGNGGDSWPNTANGGFGGGSFSGYPGRLLLGGGGGAGHQNNNAGGDGGNGGGIVFLNTHTIIPNGGSILADGMAGVSSLANDGAGGGGGGGTLLIRTASDSLAGLTLSVNGGNGGDVNHYASHGPGGGGGGGAIYVDQADATMSMIGGTAGTHLQGSAGHHGAQPGSAGRQQAVSTAIPYMLVCDFGDSPSGYGVPIHSLDIAAAAAGELKIGTVIDYEWAHNDSSNANGDDILITSNPDAGTDEAGVSFRSPRGTGQSIFADVVVQNNSGGTVKVCGWLDVPSGGGVDGSFDAADGRCTTTSDANPTLTFQWSGLPTDRAYTTYARFRATPVMTMSTTDPSGRFAGGEVEDYLVIFDFRPTAVTIGRVELKAVLVPDFVAQLGADRMEVPALLNLLIGLAPRQAAGLTDANTATLLTAIEKSLDPDGDGRVAVLQWDTLEERGTIGFYVKRTHGDGNWVVVNNNMLPGLINAPMGGNYILADPAARSGQVYKYLLIEQEATGNTRQYGPYRVEMP